MDQIHSENDRRVDASNPQQEISSFLNRILLEDEDQVSWNLNYKALIKLMDSKASEFDDQSLDTSA
jgi:hypothetical protein